MMSAAMSLRLISIPMSLEERRQFFELTAYAARLFHDWL